MTVRQERAKKTGKRLCNVGGRYPLALRKLICGTEYVKVPCEGCKDRVWTKASNRNCLCDTCVAGISDGMTIEELMIPNVSGIPMERDCSRKEQKILAE